MRPARAVACERMGCRPNDPRIGGHWYECDELTAAIEARDREVVEAFRAEFDKRSIELAHGDGWWNDVAIDVARSLVPPGGTK